jgi:excisionase family DNA binding protein
MNTPGISNRPNLEAPLGKYPASAERGIEPLLTSEQVGEILGIHPKVVERMARRGEIPALKVGKFWRYRASRLDGWIESQSQSACQPCRKETSF